MSFDTKEIDTVSHEVHIDQMPLILPTFKSMETNFVFDLNRQVLFWQSMNITGKRSQYLRSSHRESSTSKRDMLILQIEEVFIEKENIQWLIQHLKERYPRHLIDQLKVLQSTIKSYPNHSELALLEMRRLKMTSANDFRDIAHSLFVQSQKSTPSAAKPNQKYKDLVAPERYEDIYFNVLDGGENDERV